MGEDERPTPATDEEVISSIAHGLSFARGRHTAAEDEALARTAAARVLAHLHNSFVILRKRAARRGTKP
jgi:hypothetical protein